AIFLIDRSSMRVVHVNDAACRLRELTRQQILAMEPWIIWGELSSRAELEHIYDSLITAGGASKPQEFLWRSDDGSQQWLDIRRQAYRLRERWTIIILVRDVTERKDAENKLRRLNRLYAMVSGINALVVRARDRDELFRDACRIAVEYGEFERAWVGIVDQAGSNIVPIAFAGVDEKTIAAIKELFASSAGAVRGPSFTASAIRKKTVVVSNDLKNDPRVMLSKTYTAVGSHSLAVFPLLVADNAVGVIVLHTSKAEFFDQQGLKLLTELAGNIAYAIDYIDNQERLDYLAYYDALTGLANRRLFLERLSQHLRSAASGKHKSALFLIDLERFKSINDSLGRAAGDSLLQQVAQWLTQVTGDASVLARVGADQFAIVLPQVSQHGDLSRLLEKTVTAFLNHPFTLNDSIYRIAGKIGVVLYPDDGGDADTLFKHAEAALKKAKASGDRYLFYAQRMSETLSGRLGLENQLRQALDNEEFVLHYQPKINLISGELTGAEALIRWNSPQAGLVPPGRFIPILEQTGLIHEVGRWALHKAIAEYLRWLATGLPAVPIAVNVSPLQLRNRGFVAEIAQAVSITANAAAGLELEITESLIMEDVEHSIASLQSLRAMGISIAIDDFGTGFSSLSYLSRLPMDTLKIDRSFVLDITSGPGAATLVSVIINLAHALKLKAVAEGVETEEQLRQLRSLDCDEVQGYLCGRPVPGTIFESKYLSSSRSDTNQTRV
ncbi:MAG TPA: EAL domain-containing protein, partial [Steroidobacteraceae bacterium]